MFLIPVWAVVQRRGCVSVLSDRGSGDSQTGHPAVLAFLVPIFPEGNFVSCYELPSLNQHTLAEAIESAKREPGVRGEGKVASYECFYGFPNAAFSKSFRRS